MKAMSVMISALAVSGLAVSELALPAPAAGAQAPVDEFGTRVFLLAQQPSRAPQRARPPQVPRAVQERWPEVTEPVSHTVRLGPNGTLDLENFAGNVTITGGRGNEVRIEAVKRVRDPREAQARRLLEALRIGIIERGGNVEIRTEYPNVRTPFGAVDYTIVVPSSANVTVRAYNGDVRVSAVNGELRAETVGGALVASDIRRVRALKTMSGRIEVRDSESDELTINTMSGDLVLDNLKGRVFDMQSVMGDMHLTNVEPSRVVLRSMTGNIEYLGRFTRNGRYDFQSHGGNIQLTPTNNQGFDVLATTMGGHFRSDFPLTIMQESGGQRARLGKVIRGTFGDAGAAITVQSFQGNIVIIRR